MKKNVTSAPVQEGKAAGALPLLVTPGLHELYAAREADGIAASGLALALTAESNPTRPFLWVRHGFLDSEAGLPSPAGLHEFGLDPARLILVPARDADIALQAALEGTRCPALAAVILDFRGAMQAYDLSASRRLALASRASGLKLLFCRSGVTPHPSAAETRWLIRAAPSRPLAAQAPGSPAFAITLLRARNGQEGHHAVLEWNRDVCRLEILPASSALHAGREQYAAPGDNPPLPRGLVPLPLDRARPAPSERFRKAG